MARAATGRGTGATPSRAARAAVRAACRALEAAPGVLVLAGVGAPGRAAEELAAGAAELAPEAAVLAFGTRGARDAEGVVDDGAVLALALNTPARVAAGSAEDAGALGEALRHRPARPLVLLGQRGLTPAALAAFAAGAETPHIVGGTPGAGGLASCAAGAAPREAPLAALRIEGGLRLAREVAASVRTLGPERRVSACAEGFVRTLDDAPALRCLSEAAQQTSGRPLVLVRIARPGEGAILRGIGGVDPRRGAIYVGQDVREGDSLAYVTPDPEGEHEAFSGALARLHAGLAGGLPVLLLGWLSAGASRRRRIVPRATGATATFAVETSAEVAPAEPTVRLAGHSNVLGLLFAPS